MRPGKQLRYVWRCCVPRVAPCPGPRRRGKQSLKRRSTQKFVITEMALLGPSPGWKRLLVGAFFVIVQIHRSIVYSTTITRAYREHNPSEDPPADVQIDPRCRSSCVFCGLAAQFVSPRRPLNVYTILVNTQEGVSVLCSSQNLFKRGIMFQHN